MSKLSGTDADEDFGVPGRNLASCDCHAATGPCHAVTVGRLGENLRKDWIFRRHDLPTELQFRQDQTGLIPIFL